MSFCLTVSLSHTLSLQAVHLPDAAFTFLDMDGDGEMTARELRARLDALWEGNCLPFEHVDTSEGMLSIKLAAPGLRPRTCKWLLLPAWHHALPLEMNPSSGAMLLAKQANLNPKPSTLNPQPSTLNPQPSTLNPTP